MDNSKKREKEWNMVYFFLEWLGAYKRRKEQGFFFNSFLLQSFHFFLLNFQKGENWCNILKKCLSIHSIHFSLPRWMRFIASLSKYQTFVYAFQFSSSLQLYPLETKVLVFMWCWFSEPSPGSSFGWFWEDNQTSWWPFGGHRHKGKEISSSFVLYH